MTKLIRWRPKLIGFPKRKPRRDDLIPPSFIGEESTLGKVFIEFAKKYQDDEKNAIQRYTFLPDSIKETWVWLDKIAEIWRYKFCPPYDRLPEGMIVAGASSNLPVDELYLAIKIADERLTPVQLIAYRERLAQVEKHAAAIFEMRPLKNIKRGLRVRYEVSGMGQGRTSLDWHVKGKCLNIAFDVKYRIRPLLDHLKQTIPPMNKGAATATASAPNPEDLFRGTDAKFEKKCFLWRRQGLWVYTDIKEDEERLKGYFKNALNRKKIHFVVISDWKDDAYILARNRFISRELKRTFHLTESKRFITQDYDKVAVERA